MSSQIIGNAIGGYIITKANGPVFFIIMFGIMLLAVLGFCFVILPPKQIHVDLDQMKLMNTNYKDDSAVPPSMLTEMKDTIALICTKKMMYLNMQLLWSGTSIAFWSAMLIPIMTLELADHTDFSENQKTSWALYGMVSFGFGEVIGGYIMGMVIDKCGSK
jgi:predicted MFS family arabinose efflux permease